MIYLRDYQSDCVEAILSWWRNENANALAVIPTGGGKTIIFSSIGKRLRDIGINRILVLAHRTELVQQAVDKWKKVDPGESIGIYQGNRRDLHCDIIAASIASCYTDVEREEDCQCVKGEPIVDAEGWPTGKHAKLPVNKKCPTCKGKGKIKVAVRKGRVHELPLDEIDLIIIDEVHHFTKDSQYAEVIKAVRDVNPGCLLLGVTATPFRADGQGLGHAFKRVAFSRGIKWMIEQQYLSPATRYCVDLHEQVDFSQVKVSKSSGDFIDKELGHVMDRPSAREQIVKAWIANAGPGTCPQPNGRPTAVFCPTVDAAKHLCEEFVAAGVNADWVCGDKKQCPDDRRKSVLKAFDEGRLTVVVNVGVLTEGWDAQRTSCIVVARPTKSLGLYQQMVGRGLRWLGPKSTKEESEALGKANCLVLDCVGSSGLGLISIADLSDESPELNKKKKAKELEEEQQGLALPREIETQKIVGFSTYEVDLFGGGVDWCRIDGCRVASVRQGVTIIIHPQPEVMVPTSAETYAMGYRVLLVNLVSVTKSSICTLVEGAPEKEALKVAEAYAIEHGVRDFLQPSEFKKRKPATEKQRKHLTEWNTRYDECRIQSMPSPNRMSIQQASGWLGYLASLRLRRAYADRTSPDGFRFPSIKDVEQTMAQAAV